jgi:Skp family chaperone for outer membrane proteins
MKSLFPRALAFALFLTPVLASQAQQKVGYIDLKKVFEGYWKRDVADKNLKDRAGEFDKKKKEMLDDYQKAQEDYKKALDSANDQAVSLDEREKRKKSAEVQLVVIREIEQSLQLFDRSARAQLGELEKRERDKILAEIGAVVSARAKAAGYSLVLDTAAETVNNTSFVLFTDGKDDLTSDILKQLNANAPVALPSSTAPEPGKKK